MKNGVGKVRSKKGRSKKPERRKESAPYYVYLLLCDDESYYTGYTNDVAARFERHKKGRGARYTKMRRPRTVVYVEEFKTRAAASKRERQIKALSHKEKYDLVTIGSDPRHAPHATCRE